MFFLKIELCWGFVGLISCKEMFITLMVSFIQIRVNTEPGNRSGFDKTFVIAKLRSSCGDPDGIASPD